MGEESFASAPPPLADLGLLVIHGVGSHQQTTTLRAMLDPFLQRLSAENLLVDVVGCNVPGAESDRPPFDGLRIQYKTAATDGEPTTLLVVEGRWDGSFVKEGADRISSWVTRSASSMVLQVLRYHWRGLWRGLGSLAVLGLFAFAVGTSQIVAGIDRISVRSHHPDLTGAEDVHWYVYFFAALALSVLLAVPDTTDFLKQPNNPFRKLWTWLVLVATLVVYQLQRGIVILVTAIGVIVAPILFMLLRWLSSVPLLSGFVKGGVLPKAESALMLGGFGDMEAIVATPATSAEIEAHLRRALIALEQGVATDADAPASITVVAHSAGGPLSWALLSEPAIKARQAARPFRYQLITVGAALAWAKHGFETQYRQLDHPLVNSSPAGNPLTTRWWNVFSTWDPVPHGPIVPGEFQGFTAEGTDAKGNPTPNVIVRNLGAPVPDEHGEYWRNQQEFVPLLGRALSPSFRWAREAKRNAALLTNCRVSLLATLVRTRLVVLTIPFAALLAGLQGVNFVDPASTADSDSWAIRKIGVALGALGPRLLGDKYEGVRAFLQSSPGLTAVIVTIALLLFALGLMDVYTNICWHRLGRAVSGLSPTPGAPRVPISITAALWMWTPVVVILPVILFQLPLRNSTVLALSIANWALVVADFAWVWTCAAAVARPETDRVRMALCAGVGRATSNESRKHQLGATHVTPG